MGDAVSNEVHVSDEVRVSDPVHVARAKVGGLVAHREADDPELLDARQELKAAMLRRHIRKVVAEAPPLSDDQRSALALLLLRPGGADAS
jgi:hypothetical protein